MADPASKAQDQLLKAQKKLQGWSFFGMSTKYEDAAELFDKAGKNFKLAKMWPEAASANLAHADCQLKLNSDFEAASAYVEAASCYKKTNHPDAVTCLEKAIDKYTDMGRLHMAAAKHKDIGEILEANATERNPESAEKAMYHYEQAADLYSGEDQNSNANTCKLKVAMLAGSSDLWQKAVDLFEAVAISSLDSNLLKFSVKNHFLLAGLCQMMCSFNGSDLIGMTNAIERYQDLDPSFTTARECKFLQDLTAAAEDADVEQFTRVVAEFDQITRLDQWKTSVLCKIKRKVTSKEQEDEPDLT